MINDPANMAAILVPALAVTYFSYQLFRPFISLYSNFRRAQTIGLPIKVLPVPQGLFSFFAFQLLRRLRLLRPGTKLHKLLNMGRPDGYELHKEMGDVFVTVNPAGLGLIVADPQVVSYVSGRRTDFPKPPNTGAIINIYGRNVINADGDLWRFHRRVTGPVFSERIHRVVWLESKRQAKLMLDTWAKHDDNSVNSLTVDSLADDTLRLGLHVITGSAYGCPLEWDDSPPLSKPTTLTYRRSLEQLTHHLMPLFLTPRWLLKLAPLNTTWGRAWEAYEAFGSYMDGMIERERARMADGDADDNLLTALIQAENEVDEKVERTMSRKEVLGNAFIFLFAGHETTANTLHYSLLLLALNPSIQELVLEEIDEMYERAQFEKREDLEYELDYTRAKWIIAVMSETLRVYTPTGVVNKWTATDQPITYKGQNFVIPRGTRIAINGTGVHSNPKVWGEDADQWKPERWVINDPILPRIVSTATSREPSPERISIRREGTPESTLLTPPPTPGFTQYYHAGSAYIAPSRPGTPNPSTRSSSPNRLSIFVDRSPSPGPFGVPLSPTPSMTGHYGILKPARGSFLPFSDGSRMCSGRKFATVEFVSVITTLLKDHRVELLSPEEGWTQERVRKILSGRKAGALTLQPPENIPVRFVRR